MNRVRIGILLCFFSSLAIAGKPAAPSNLAAVASVGQVALTWTDKANNETGYELERATGSGAFVLLAVLPANATAQVDTSVSASTKYTYRVRAGNDSGDSGYSNKVSVTTPAAPVCTSFGWCKQGTVQNVTNNYTPVVSLDATHIRVYSNSDGSVDGDLWLRACSWSTCGPATKVLHITTARDQFIRTNAVVRGDSGTYYALLYTGDGYPTQGGYSPSWATSPDGVTWTWQGPITIFGRNQSSAAALVVDESRNDDFRFMAWLDLAGGLVMMHSPDGVAWASDGLNMWPIANESPQFVTAAKDQYGYHLIGANTWPATALRHLWSCDGLHWRVLETASDVINTAVGKGTNLVYEPSTNLLQALTSGMHWQIAAQPYTC